MHTQHVTRPAPAALSATAATLPVEPWMKQAIDASFARVKAAVARSDLAAFTRELHPEVIAQPFKDIAEWFSELRDRDIAGWQVGELVRDQYGVGGRIKGSDSDKDVISFAFTDPTTLKLAFLGYLDLP